MFNRGAMFRSKVSLSSVPGEGVYERPISRTMHKEPGEVEELRRSPFREFIHDVKEAFKRNFLQRTGQATIYHDEICMSNLPALHLMKDSVELQNAFLYGGLEREIKIAVPLWHWNHKESVKWLKQLLNDLPEEMENKPKKELEGGIKSLGKKEPITGDVIYKMDRGQWMSMLGCTAGAFVHEQMLLIKTNPFQWLIAGIEVEGSESAGSEIQKLGEREVQLLTAEGLARHRTICSCFENDYLDVFDEPVPKGSTSTFSLKSIFRSKTRRSSSNGSHDKHIPQVTRKRARSSISI